MRVGGKSSYNRSLQIQHLARALAMAQGEFRSAVKDSTNPYYSSKYADYESCVQATQEPLAKHGLSIVHFPVMETDESGLMWAGVTTLLCHESGQFFECQLMMPVVKQEKGKGWVASVDPHSLGSAITYATRYTYFGVCRLGREDDDANAAVGARGAEIAKQHAPREPARRPEPDNGFSEPNPPARAQLQGAPSQAAPVVKATDLSGPKAPPSGDSVIVHQGMVEAKSMKDLVAIFNALSAPDKKLYMDHFQVRRQEFSE